MVSCRAVTELRWPCLHLRLQGTVPIEIFRFAKQRARTTTRCWLRQVDHVKCTACLSMIDGSNSVNLLILCRPQRRKKLDHNSNLPLCLCIECKAIVYSNLAFSAHKCIHHLVLYSESRTGELRPSGDRNAPGPVMSDHKTA